MLAKSKNDAPGRDDVKRSGALLGLLLLVVGARAWWAPAGPVAQTYDATSLGGAMRWRPIGPFRGGRTKAITGVPGDLSLAYIAAMYDSRLAGGTLDYGGYHTPRLDSLFDRTREASDTLALRDAWYDVQRELAREAPAAWIYHSRGVQGVSRRLAGVVMDLRGELATLQEWRIAPPSEAAAP